MEQTALGLATLNTQGMDLNFSKKDRDILRGLAGKVAEIASRPSEEIKRKLWYDHNALKATRPVVFCDPENGWNEMITESMLECENDLARVWENHFRKEIFWGESMGDDRPVEAVFPVSYSFTETNWGLQEERKSGGHGGSYTWIPAIRDYDKDLPKMKFPEITLNMEHTLAQKNLAENLFGDLLPIKLKGAWWWSLGMTSTLIYLRGLEEFMMDFFLFPDQLKALMKFLSDGHLAKLEFLEKNHLLSLNNDGTYVGSGGYGFSNELPQKDFNAEHVRTLDMWGFSESQESTAISPEFFEEFIFPYQLPILNRFGLNCYGCCEPLDLRWNVIKTIPNLRRVSVSPWSDIRVMSANLGDQYIYSRKPTPTDLADPDPDWTRIRKDIRSFYQITKNNRVEIIMKDNHTLGNNPQNAINWCKIAKEEAEAL